MTKNSLIRSFYLLTFLLTTSLSANFSENNEKALYALISLGTHLENQLSDFSKEQNENPIQFLETDISLLWDLATDSTLAPQIQQAKLYYEHAANSSGKDRLKQLSKAKELIENSWALLNPYYQSIIAKSSQNQDDRHIIENSNWIKNQLDLIFAQNDVTENDDTFAEAGFEIICKRSSKMIVAKHSKIPKYLVKVYLHSDKPAQSWKWLVNRCEGAENIRNLIKAKKITCFVVPDKWIYPLPGYYTTQEEKPIATRTSPALLVVSHMNLVDQKSCREAWATKITKKHLRELYCILSHGFASTYLVQNIPYTKEGKFACLDTEYPFRQHRLERVLHLLSDEMKIYWDHLVRTGGKK
ncbi:MAG: hypothetical protein H0U27_12935 [Nitrosopumilus sp.]|nr:hypothetical protein [Nitrosopumilus sp.]